MNFKDRCVLVIGSSGSIGRHIALRFAEAGANVIVRYHSNRSDAERCVNSIQELGRDATAVKADLGWPTDVNRLFHQAVNEFHRIDVLINNTGVYSVHPLGEMIVEQWDQVLNSNLYSERLLAGIQHELWDSLAQYGNI